MPRIRCESCGRETDVPRRSASLRCAGCRAWLQVLPWRRLWATEELAARIRADEELPTDLRVELEELVARRAEVQRERLEAAAPPPDEATAEPAPAVPAKPAPRPTGGLVPPPLARAPREAAARGPRPKRRRPTPRGPTVWARLSPVFAENLGFGLAAFLILAGAVYFTTTAWTTMSGPERLLVVVGGLVLLGGLLFAAARLLNRAGNLPEVERTLLLIVAFLVPIAAIPAGILFDLSPARAALATVVVLALGGLASRRLVRVLDPALGSFVPWASILLCVPVLAGVVLGRNAPVPGALGASLLLLGIAWVYGRRVVPGLRAGRWAGLWPPVLFAFTTAVAGGHVAVASRHAYAFGTVLATLGIVVAALGAALVTVEPALFVRRTFGRRRSAVVLVVALALGITGTLMAVGDAVGLLCASVLGAYACLRGGLALPVPWFALPGLVLSALAYLKSPAPVKALALQLRDEASRALGYVDRPLPLAWYGITFLPYVFACAWVGWAFLRRGQAARARVFLAWTFLAAAGLSALALFGGEGDLRAPAAVFVAQGGLLLAIGVALRHRGFTLAGALGVFAGASCAVLHLDPSAPVAVLVLAAAGLVAVLVTAWIARRGGDPVASEPVRSGLLDAAALLALVLVAVTTVDALRLSPGPTWHALGPLLLTALLGAVAFALRRPEGIALAALALGAAGVRFVTGIEPDVGGDVLFLVLAALSGVVLATPRIDALLPAALRHPRPAAPASIGSWTPLGALSVQLLGFVLLLERLPEPGWTIPLATGLLLGAVVLALAAARETQPWPLYPAVFELTAAGVVTGTALTACPWYGTAGLAGAAGSLVVICLPLLVGRRRALLGNLTLPLRHLLPLLVALFAVWAAALVLAWWRGHTECVDGWLLAVGSLAVALAVRATLARHVTSHALRAACLYAGTLFAPTAAGLLVALDAAPHAWPLAFVGAAIAVRLWAGPDRRLHPPALLHLLLALTLATGLAFAGPEGAPYLLAALVLVAAGGWVTARRRPVLGWTVLLVALLLALSIPLGARILGLDHRLQPMLWLLFAALTYAALGVRRLGLHPTAVRLFADPILAAGVAGALLQAIQVAVHEPPTTRAPHDLLPTVVPLRLAEGALGLAALARSLVLPFPLMGRRTLALFVVGLAAFALAPANMAIHGGDARFWRPDVEIALLALLLAFTTPLSVKPRVADGTGDLGTRLPWPILLALFGIGLTSAELRDLSTPLTLLAATASFFVLLVRDRGPLLAGLTGYSVLVTALAFASWWQPMPGTVQDGILLLYGAVSALVAPVLGVAARQLAREERAAWLRRAARELYPVAVSSAVLAFGFVVGDLAVNTGTRASALEVLLAGIGLALPGLAALWGALRAGRPQLIHVALLAGLLFYTFLVQRTGALAFLDGYHLHALVVMGATLLFLSDFHAGPLGRLLAVDGLTLAVPAAVHYVPMALGLGPWGSLGAASSALALAAVAFAAGARRLAWPFLVALAAVLVNCMLFAFWRTHGLMDPAFYGIPPGLTLLGSAMLLRGRITRAANLALVVPGLALLYGSVALQVVRADDPVHAVLLLGLGLVTVVLGFLLRRNAWLVVGVVVIVLDVVVYLAVHGFETGFFGAALLVVAGLVVMAVAALATQRRRKGAG